MSGAVLKLLYAFLAKKETTSPLLHTFITKSNHEDAMKNFPDKLPDFSRIFLGRDIWNVIGRILFWGVSVQYDSKSITTGIFSIYIVKAIAPVFRCFYFRCDICQAASRANKGAIIHWQPAIGDIGPRVNMPHLWAGATFLWAEGLRAAKFHLQESSTVVIIYCNWHFLPATIVLKLVQTKLIRIKQRNKNKTK